MTKGDLARAYWPLWWLGMGILLAPGVPGVARDLVFGVLMFWTGLYVGVGRKGSR